MAAQFTDAAVDALADYLESNYPAYLRIVETDLGLDSGDLTDPVAYVRADLPFDNRNPRVDVFEDDWDFSEDDKVLILAEVGCSVVWSYSGDAQIEAGELLARRCLTAMVKCIWADRSLGGVVRSCLFEPGSAGSVTEEGVTRHAFLQPVRILLQEVM